MEDRRGRAGEITRVYSWEEPNISPVKSLSLSLPISFPFLYYTILHYIIKDKRFVLFT